MPARLGYHPHQQPPRRSYSQHVHVETEGIANEPARHGRDLPELDVDWPRDERWNLSVAEQEAQFQVHKMGQIWSRIMQPCPVCKWPHSIADCPLIFEHSPIKPSRIRERRIAFQERMEKSQELHDTVMYLRTKFTRRLPSSNLVPLPRSKTLDAPPLAREYLSKFDYYVRFLRSRINDDSYIRIQSEYSYYTGYYPTTDDDGRPFLILFFNSARFDDAMLSEIKLIRTFVAQYNRGTKSLHGSSPELDTRPIGIVIVSGRWHTSRSIASLGIQCLNLIIASEHNWYHGDLRWGIHVGTEDNKLDGVNPYWSSASLVELVDKTGPFYLDIAADTKYAVDENKTGWVIRAAIALLRDVREPVEHFFGIEGREGMIENYYRICKWWEMLLPRAAALYGLDSPQYRALLGTLGRPSDRRKAENPSIFGLAALPRWKHILSRISMADKPYDDQVIWRSIFSQREYRGGAD